MPLVEKQYQLYQTSIIQENKMNSSVLFFKVPTYLNYYKNKLYTVECIIYDIFYNTEMKKEHFPKTSELNKG